MALWSMVGRLFVCLIISCCRCNCFSISDTARFSRCIVVTTKPDCASLDVLSCQHMLSLSCLSEYKRRSAFSQVFIEGIDMSDVITKYGAETVARRFLGLINRCREHI